MTTPSYSYSDTHAASLMFNEGDYFKHTRTHHFHTYTTEENVHVRCEMTAFDVMMIRRETVQKWK